MKEHLQRQDATYAVMESKIDAQRLDTAAIVDMWDGGVKAARFFCRAADAWRFILKQVLLPIGAPLLGLYGTWYYTQFHRFPEWLSAAFKFLMAAL